MKGFTLIEIVISVGISLLLMAGVVLNYNNYNDAQKLKQAALTVKNDFRFYQSKALTGEKPGQSCPQLLGYQVTFTATTYTFKAQCSPAQPSAPNVIYTLPATITFSSYPSPFMFRVVSRGTTLTSPTSIILSGSNRLYTLRVSTGGDISDLGLQ